MCENKVDGDSDALSVSLRLPEGGSCDPTDGVDSAFSRQSWGAMPASLANPGGLQAAPDCMTQGPLHLNLEPRLLLLPLLLLLLGYGSNSGLYMGPKRLDLR